MNTIDCFSGLPFEYESFLIEKYDSFITTCRYSEIYFPLHEKCYLIVRDDGKMSELLVFANKGNTATCMNSLARIDSEIVNACILKIFEKYPMINRVEIVASYTPYEINKSVLYKISDDYILNIPESTEDFYSVLGSKTRKHLRQRVKKLEAEFGSVNFVIKSGKDIEQPLIDKIVEFNRERMKQKGTVSGIDPLFQYNMFKYSERYGMVGYLELDGRIVAGSISTVLNGSIFIHVIAHDNEFVKYNVGEVCAFDTIQASIDNGVSSVHFLWGESELKKRFMAQPSLLYFYYVYKDYSLDYMLRKIHAVLYANTNNFKHSKYSRPLRNVIRTIRRRHVNEAANVT